MKCQCIVGITAFLMYLPDPAEGVEPIVTYPDNACLALSKQSTLFSTVPARMEYRAIASHHKADIVCVAKDLRINAPIRTNGGDVFIYADTVAISALIDTRVYVSADRYSHVGPLIPGALPAPFAQQIFMDYYRRSPQAAVASNKEVYLPELPSGLTPAWGSFCASIMAEAGHLGTAPPDADIRFEYVRSGNAFIYARHIQIDEAAAGLDVDESDPLTCEVGQNDVRKVAFLADGARARRCRQY